MNDNEDLSEYSINYEKIIHDRTMLGVTRTLAIDITNNPYMTVGSFLRDIQDSDLQLLIDIIDTMDEDDSEPKNPRAAELLLMSQILSRAEGVIAEDIEEIVRHMNMFTTMIVCESLYRKGLADVIHENMSFGVDAGNLIIAKKK